MTHYKPFFVPDESGAKWFRGRIRTIVRKCNRTITYTRAVYRKTLDEVYELLNSFQGPTAAADRARLETLPRNENVLALARPHYDNVRANILYTHLDKRGRGRRQIAAELPLLLPLTRKNAPPAVTFPRPDDEPTTKRRIRESALDDKPFLQSIPVFRYVR